jgi:hypothetical protein
MDNLAAIFSAVALFAVLAVLVWGVAGGWRRLLGNEPGLVDALARCASCATRPVCETGALANWLGSRPPGCPAVERLKRSR